MRRYLFSIFVALTASLTMSAQYVVSDKYKLWFEDSGHEITGQKVRWTSKPVNEWQRKL